VDALLERGTLDRSAFGTIDKANRCKRALCLRPQTKRMHDAMQMAQAWRSAADPSEVLIVPKPDDAKSKIILAPLMPIRSRCQFSQTRNAEKVLVCNNEGFVVKSVDVAARTFVLTRSDLDGNPIDVTAYDPDNRNDITVSASDFFGNYELDFAITVQRVQGNELSVPYDILDVDKMSRNELNTVLSRAKCIDQIHLCEGRKTSFQWYHHPDRLENVTIIVPPNVWFAGVVYQLEDHKGIYIGETVAEGLSEAQASAAVDSRFAEHVLCDKTPFDKLLTSERARLFLPTVLLADLFASKKQLLSIEQRFIREAKASRLADPSQKRIYNAKVSGARALRISLVAPKAPRIRMPKLKPMTRKNKEDGTVKSHFLRLQYSNCKRDRKDMTYRVGVEQADRWSKASVTRAMSDWWQGWLSGRSGRSGAARPVRRARSSKKPRKRAAGVSSADVGALRARKRQRRGTKK
jgi:hypothetical protein